MPLIPITGVGADWIKPGGYLELKFGQGPSTAAAGLRGVLIAMAILSTGSATANLRYGPIRSAQQVATLAGEGSSGHEASETLFRENPFARAHFLAVALTTGGSPIQADLDVTAAGTVTAPGTDTVWVRGEAATFTYASGATATTRGTGLKDAINAKTWLPVTATNVAGVVTIAAKQAGIAMGDGTTGAIRVHVETTSGTGATLVTENGGSTDALGLGAAADGADGTTTQAAQLATALTSVDAIRDYYIITETWDATSLGNVQTHVTNKSYPRPGLRSVAIAAYTGTVANGQTLATGRNYERLQIALMPNSESSPSQLVGAMAGARSLQENTFAAFNFDNYQLNSIKVPYDTGDYLTDTDANDAITDGLTPIMSANGVARIAFSATTRSKNAAGTNDDRRALETHRVSVADQFGDELLSVDSKFFEGKVLKSDKLNTDGTIDHTQRIGPRTVTPHHSGKPVIQLLRDFDNRELLQETDKSVQALRVLRDPQNTGRLEYSIQIRVVDLPHQRTYEVSEVSPG